MAQERKKVLVLGAGYAGLQTDTKLQKELSAEEAEITQFNKNVIHYQAPWLHEAIKQLQLIQRLIIRTISWIHNR